MLCVYLLPCIQDDQHNQNQIQVISQVKEVIKLVWSIYQISTGYKLKLMHLIIKELNISLVIWKGLSADNIVAIQSSQSIEIPKFEMKMIRFEARNISFSRINFL